MTGEMFFIYNTDAFVGSQERDTDVGVWQQLPLKYKAAFLLSCFILLHRGFFCSGLLSTVCS